MECSGRDAGRFRRTAMGLMILSTSNGPTKPVCVTPPKKRKLTGGKPYPLSRLVLWAGKR